jgi:riboflavin kinase / FMN adenylyltransferase
VQIGGRSVVTIGAYDGVHIGHRLVIDHVRSIAETDALASVVVTFDRHPASVVRPESAPLLLTDLDQKLELLRATGVDDVVVIQFDENRATETAEDFVTEVLVSQLSAAVVVVGRDFHFGKGRGGNVRLLEAMGSEYGFRVVPFDLVTQVSLGGGAPDEIVSSTRVRKCIAAGALAEAARLLGRPHEVRGIVCEDGSIAPPAEILIPPAGRYAARVAELEPGAELRPTEVAVGLPTATGAVTVLGECDVDAAAGAAVRVVFDRPT